MKDKQISYASSISADSKYDPFDTLEYCKQNSIKLSQLYMDQTLTEDAPRVKKLRKFASENNIRLTCHAPKELNSSLIDTSILKPMKKLLKDQEKKIIIVHFDEETAIDEAMITIESLSNNDFTVGLENFYKAQDEISVISNTAKYNLLLSLSAEHEFDIIPVLDLPRLFIKGISENTNPLLLTKTILANIALLPYPIILHMIDVNNNSQERDTWVPLGEGLLPYKELLTLIRNSEIEIDHAVLEYESKELADKSLSFLRNH